MAIKVYWASRDLAGVPVGNHHFVLITLGANDNLPPITTQVEGGVRFITLGAFKKDGKLVFQANEPSDVLSVREVIDPDTHTAWYSSDFDMERHEVSSPKASGFLFAQTLVRLAKNYERNTENSKTDYTLLDQNCAAWVNTLFEAAGVSDAVRQQKGEFWGVDWGEEDKLSTDLFKD